MADARRDMYFLGTKDKTELIYKDKLSEISKNHKEDKIVCDKRLLPLLNNAVCYEDNEVDLGKVMIKLAKKKFEDEKDKNIFNPILVKANYIQTPPVF